MRLRARVERMLAGATGIAELTCATVGEEDMKITKLKLHRQRVRDGIGNVIRVIIALPTFKRIISDPVLKALDRQARKSASCVPSHSGLAQSAAVVAGERLSRLRA